MASISKKWVKRRFKRRGIKIGDKAVVSFIKLQEKRIEDEIDKVARNSKISGRKVVKTEDFCQ